MWEVSKHDWSIVFWWWSWSGGCWAGGSGRVGSSGTTRDRGRDGLTDVGNREEGGAGRMDGQYCTGNDLRWTKTGARGRGEREREKREERRERERERERERGEREKRLCIQSIVLYRLLHVHESHISASGSPDSTILCILRFWFINWSNFRLLRATSKQEKISRTRQYMQQQSCTAVNFKPQNIRGPLPSINVSHKSFPRSIH